MSYTCLVCKKNHNEECCPRCGFQVIEILGDYEVGLQNLKPFINKQLDRFQRSVTVGMEICLWTDADGVIVPNGKEYPSFGNLAELREGEHWLDRRFARIPDCKDLSVVCYVRITKSDGQSAERKIQVKLPNLLEAELQQIGVRITDRDTFVLLLKNDGGNRSESEEIPLFED